jgi:hypothetical protein
MPAGWARRFFLLFSDPPVNLAWSFSVHRVLKTCGDVAGYAERRLDLANLKLFN